MDAQNAVEPASTKPAASPKRPGSESDRPRSSAARSSGHASSGHAKPEASLKDARPSASGSASTSAGAPNANDDDGGAEGNSDAETIVLPGKDGHSPSKVRKIIKREDRSDGEDAPSVSRGRKHDVHGKQDRDGDRGDRVGRKDKSVSVADRAPSDRAPSLGAKKKRLAEKSKTKDGSSGLSSAPASPPQRRRRSSNALSKSDSETALVESPRTTKEKQKPVDKLVPHKRKAPPRPDSDDDAESRKVRRQRISGSGLDASRKPHNPPAKPQHDTHSHSSTRTRSVSPQPRAHRRSVSTQLPGLSSNGLSHKKKRVPAPLQSTDYHSDESSGSGSPHPRSSKLRSLTTPATAESTVSPAKMAPHKKHLDAHGQTFLARACAKGEYETAKQRLQERPEDINVADYAGNTPLQIAALNGYVDIVKLLVAAGCNLDCVNNDKDTPLIDAVENGHLEVVRILLAAGVNPRKANAYGQDPIDRVNDDREHAEEIRQALEDAKQRIGERRRTSEDHHLDHTDARSSNGPESPRRSPGASSSIHAAMGRRAGTVRSTKTSNHLLYMPMDDKTLRSAAAKGDEETVTRILQVRDKFDDPESMVAAARGGHEIVMQLLLALGKANPDPLPISNNEYSTPMLAAIGQENLEVVRLLLDQAGFDPTKQHKGETYYELARRRRGPNWMEEEHMLKEAYDKRILKDGSKTKSPSRRDHDREPRRNRAEPKDDAARSHKRKASSPTRESKRAAPPKLSTSPKEKRRSNSFGTQPDDHTSPKRGPGRPKKDDRIPTIAISDREASPVVKQHTAKAKRAESDLTAASSEGETVKPRRKLVSARELKGSALEKPQRRASMTSNASTLKEPSSPREEVEKPDKSQKTEKYHDRTKALKRDESRDRQSDGSVKRHRSSATPPHLGSSEKDVVEGPAKRRRLDVDGKERQERRLKTSSSDDRHLKAPSHRDSSATATGSRVGSKGRDDDDRRLTPKMRKSELPTDHGRRESGKSMSSENSIHVKSEDPDVEMPDADPPSTISSASRAAREKQHDAEDKKKRADAETQAQARDAKRKDEEKRRKELQEKEKEKLRLEEEAKRRNEEEARRREEQEQKRREEEERRQKEEKERQQREEEERRKREEEERRRVEEEERRQKEEEERKRKEAEEKKRKEEEERLRKEEEERRRKEEEERKRREEEERKIKEEEERKKREEEERLRKEQLEREAAEELRRKREEEERRERAHREELERRRALREAKEAEARRVRLEQELARLAKLPALLRWFDGYANPKTAEVAVKFRKMQGVRYDCVEPRATGTQEGREQWLLNTQVALLLGEKDLSLSRYTAWTRIPASYIAKQTLWRVEGDRYALTSPALYELGQQLPDYYGGEDPWKMHFRVTQALRTAAWEKFAAMDTFFVKASDFMFIVPTIPHLHGIQLAMEYRELPETEALASQWVPLQKWKSDPDANRNYGFAPGTKRFVNGVFVSEVKACLGEASTSPFPEKRVPRRGLLAVTPDDPSYAAICKEQGLEHLVEGADSPLLPNGVRVVQGINGPGSPSPLVATMTNSTHPISPSSESGPAQARPLVNGVNGPVNGPVNGNVV